MQDILGNCAMFIIYYGLFIDCCDVHIYSVLRYSDSLLLLWATVHGYFWHNL